jgi:hypothetical protein
MKGRIHEARVAHAEDTSKGDSTWRGESAQHNRSNHRAERSSRSKGPTARCCHRCQSGHKGHGDAIQFRTTVGVGEDIQTVVDEGYVEKHHSGPDDEHDTKVAKSSFVDMEEPP